MPEKLPNLLETKNPEMQEAQQTPKHKKYMRKTIFQIS